MTWLLSPLPPKWHAALRDVTARGVDARIAAATRLVEPADDAQLEQALPALERLLGDRDGRVRAAAVQALGEIADARSAPALIAKLEDSEALVREWAAVALGELSWQVAGEALLAATRSKHPEVRYQAVQAAANGGGADAVSQIARAIDDTDPRVRARAVEAAGLLEAEDRSPFLTRRLENALSDSELEVSGRAAILLAPSHPERAAPALRSALAHPELTLDALDAAASLQAARPRNALVAELVEQIASMAERVLGSRLVAAAAARALARMGDARGVPALRAILGAFRTQGRNLAVQTIGELGLLELAPELGKLAKRPRAVDPRTLAASLHRLRDRDPQLARALQELAGRQDGFGEAAREAAGPQLVKPPGFGN
jgi:HEAT repeat protein